MRKTTLIPALVLALASTRAFAGETAVSDATTMPTDMGPATYDASGVLKCSVGSTSYDQACGFRIVRKAHGEAEIWIANIAYNDKVVFRVLYFAQGEFTTRGDDSLDYSRDSDTWLVNADTKEYYQIPDAVIVGG